MHGILGPVVDIVSPIVSPNMIIGLLLFIMLFNWLRGPRIASSSGLAYPGMTTPQRIAAYEEIWQREENDLWDWLEERIGMQSLSYPHSERDHKAVANARRQREMSLKGRGGKDASVDIANNEREVDHAIKVTEERLDVLKRSIEKKRLQDKIEERPLDKDSRSER